MQTADRFLVRGGRKIDCRQGDRQDRRLEQNNKRGGMLDSGTRVPNLGKLPRDHPKSRAIWFERGKVVVKHAS